MSDSDSDTEASVSSDLCFLCEKPFIKEDRVTPGSAALETIKRCSKVRGDGKYNQLVGNYTVIVHRGCRKEYTKPSNVQKEKRFFEEIEKEKSLISPVKRLRSEGPFNFKERCFFCEKCFPQKKSKNDKIRQVIDTFFQRKVLEQAEFRCDKWGRQIMSRICAVDLKKNCAAYHRACWASFKRQNTSCTPGRAPSDEISQAMEVIYHYMENSDDCQFSLKELIQVSGMEGKFTELTLKTKLKQHFAERILITSTQKKVPVVCFRNQGENVIYDRWYQEKLANEEDEEIRIMRKAGEIVRKHVESYAYENASYPSASFFLEDIRDLIPKPLQVFMETVTSKRKSQNPNNVETVSKKCDVLSHCLIALVKPRSFLSPIMLSISSYIHHVTGNKTLIDLLSNLGLCSTYHDTRVLETSVIMAPEPEIKPGTFLQFAFDNCDFNVDTIDGKGTFHNLAGIKCITPANSIVNSKDRIPKQALTKISQLTDRKGIEQLKPIDFPMFSGLGQFVFEDLNKLLKPMMYVDTPSPYDVVWMLAKCWNIEGFPGWQGFLEKITNTEYSDNSSIVTLPFIMAPPSNIDTVHTALLMAADAGMTVGVEKIAVTFDLPLYMKALEVVLAAPPQSPLQKILPRLGGFHLTMSFLGCIGYVMADSGLQELLSAVYAENTTKHILTGHAYARAVRAHNLVATALCNLILKELNINEEGRSAVFDIITDINDFPPGRGTIMANETVLNVTLKLKEKMELIKQKGATSKLWIQYLEMVILLRHFLEAERTGNWSLHLNTIKLMLPYFVASGHLHYGKACYIYLQQMSRLSQEMNASEFEKYSTGYFTIRRKMKFCSGTSPDMVIEQTANREFKVAGGIVGRGFTDDILSSYVLRKPAMSLISEAMEDYSGVAFWTSDQHVDARESRMKRDNKDVKILQEMLELKNPFTNASSFVVSLGTGITGDEMINCHMAKKVGKK